MLVPVQLCLGLLCRGVGMDQHQAGRLRIGRNLLGQKAVRSVKIARLGEWKRKRQPVDLAAGEEDGVASVRQIPRRLGADGYDS